MIKIFRNIWREILCVFLTCFLLNSVFIETLDPPKEKSGQILLLFSIAFNAIFILYLLRELWRKKWRKVIATLAQQIFEKISKLIMRFFDKFDIYGKRSKNILRGETTLSFDDDIFEGLDRRKNKSQKWKQTKNNRERLGFLYRYMVTQRMKKGKRAYSSDTPMEIRDRDELQREEEYLFDMYIENRYDERKDLSKINMDVLKKQIEDIY